MLWLYIGAKRVLDNYVTLSIYSHDLPFLNSPPPASSTLSCSKFFSLLFLLSQSLLLFSDSHFCNKGKKEKKMRFSSCLLGSFLVLVVFSVAHGDPLVPALNIFGDSVVDVGNNNNLYTLVKANFAPYGRDFVSHSPTGRFCNGKLATDFTGKIHQQFKSSSSSFFSLMSLMYLLDLFDTQLSSLVSLHIHLLTLARKPLARTSWPEPILPQLLLVIMTVHPSYM